MNLSIYGAFWPLAAEGGGAWPPWPKGPVSAPADYSYIIRSKLLFGVLHNYDINEQYYVYCVWLLSGCLIISSMVRIMYNIVKFHDLNL